MGLRLSLRERTFGRWSVMRYVGKDGRGNTLWRCRCLCGTVKNVMGTLLVHGRVKSCGCLAAELTSQRCKSKLPLATRFWKHVNKNGPVPKHKPELGRCWLWTGSTIRGYGQLAERADDTQKTLRAPRVAWFLGTGAWPEHNACHHCDNPSCVRFSHLFDGTQAENMADMAAKSRSTRKPVQSVKIEEARRALL
jgi:hypothetical protein